MQRLLAAGRLALVLGLSVILVACGQFQVLKARKAFKEANAFYQQQDYKRAAAKYEEVIAADPSLTVALFYLGNSYDQLADQNDGFEPLPEFMIMMREFEEIKTRSSLR